MKTNRERAVRILDLMDCGERSNSSRIDIIERALDDAVRETIERCAKVADDKAEAALGSPEEESACMGVANAIRELVAK